MVKTLICGDIESGEQWQLLISRIKELQASAHGPFDLLFLCGKYKSDNNISIYLTNNEFPIKTYIALNKSSCGGNNSLYEELKQITNIEFIGDTKDYEVINIPKYNLTVGYMNDIASQPLDVKSLSMEEIKNISGNEIYRGCDLFFSNNWPKDMHHFLDEEELNELKSGEIGIGSGSKSVSTIATIIKPRYHFVSGKKCFYQRSPYRNSSNSPYGGQIYTCTRLISLDGVSVSKEKSKKWIHALNITPIIDLPNKDIIEEPVGTTDCPYTDIGVSLKHHNNDRNSDNPLAKKFKMENNDTTTAGTGKFFFGNMGVNSSAGLNLVAPSETACTLFIGGLTKEMTDYELKVSLPGCSQVKRPMGKSFAFADFVSHDAAKKLVESSSRKGLNVNGRTLTVGWAKDRDNNENNVVLSNANTSDMVYEREIIPPSANSKILFVGGVPTHLPLLTNDNQLDNDLKELFHEGVITSITKVTGKAYVFVEFDGYDSAMKIVTKSLNETFKLYNKALTIG